MHLVREPEELDLNPAVLTGTRRLASQTLTQITLSNQTAEPLLNFAMQSPWSELAEYWKVNSSSQYDAPAAHHLSNMADGVLGQPPPRPHLITERKERYFSAQARGATDSSIFRS